MSYRFWEICARQPIWEGQVSQAPFLVEKGQRPPLPPNNLPALNSLIARCWAQEPSERPEFKEIFSQLEAILKDFQSQTSVTMKLTPEEKVLQAWGKNELVSWNDLRLHLVGLLGCAGPTVEKLKAIVGTF
jgi:hypothetical protein